MNIGIVASSGATDTDLLSSGSLATARVVPVVSGGADTKWASRSSTADAWITGKVLNDAAGSMVGDVLIVASPLYAT